MKRSVKQWLALVSAGVMSLSMASCGDLMGQFSGMLGGGESSVSSVEKEKYDPIILKNVTKAKNVILMIGDGMGPNQIKAGSLYRDEPLVMEGFPYMTKVETRSESDYITDSAAAATALATGVRTYNSMVGQDSDGNNLETIVDIAASLGKRTGIIATEELTGATPMGFSGHSSARGNASELIKSACTSSNVNLFASYTIKAAYQNAFVEAGYEKIEDAKNISESTSDKVFGSYWIKAEAESMSGDPACLALDYLVTEALDYLSQDEDGFFLMTEGSHIDHGGHNNNFKYMMDELLAFDDAVKAVLNWAKDRDDTVVIVTADHETGGLELPADVTHDGMVIAYEVFGDSPYYTWTTSGHTATDVNCYVNGADIDFAKYSFGMEHRIKNIDVFQIMKSLITGE